MKVQPAISSSVRAAVLVVIVTLVYGLTVSDNCLAAERKRLTRLGGIGDACGFVVDAETGSYLDGVRVELLLPSDVEPIKGASGTTSKEGFYQIKAPIGSVRTGFAVERLLNLSILSTMLGGAKKVEKFVNVVQLNLRVTKDGYQPFTGPVLVFSANGEKFTAWLCPVRLAPSEAGYQSFSDTECRIGEISELELTTYTPSPGDRVGVTVTCKNLPLKPRENVSILCKLDYAENAYYRIKPKADGNPLEFVGEVPMVATEIGFWKKKKKTLEPGLYRLLAYRFESRADYGHDIWLPTPQLSRVAKGKWLAVGVDPQKRNEADSALAKINGPAKLTDVERKSAVAIIVAALPKQDAKADTEPNIWQKTEHAFIQGKYQDAWKEFASIAQYLNHRFNVINVYQFAAMVSKNPSDFKARADLSAAVRDGYTVIDPVAFKTSLDALPPMPEPRKPQDKIYAASALFASGKDQEAVSILESAVEEKSVGPEAQMALAKYYADRGEDSKARELYSKGFERRGEGKVNAFYHNYTYGRLLLENGERDAAAKCFVSALTNARNKARDYSIPATRVSARDETGSLQQYSVFTGPLLSSAVGYAYPEASSVQLILSCYDSFDSPEDDWMATATLGKSLTEIGLPKVALPMLEKAALAFPDQQYVLASYALALHVSGDTTSAAKVLEELLSLNPRNPEGLRLAELSKPEAKTTD